MMAIRAGVRENKLRDPSPLAIQGESPVVDDRPAPKRHPKSPPGARNKHLIRSPVMTLKPGLSLRVNTGYRPLERSQTR
jgi:hypothetical protein